MANSFLSGLAQGVGQSMDRATQQQWSDEYKKMQVKMFKLQLEQQESVKNALGKITGLLFQGMPQPPQQTAVPSSVADFTQQSQFSGQGPLQNLQTPQPEAIPQPNAPVDLTQILATPQGQAWGLQAGIRPELMLRQGGGIADWLASGELAGKMGLQLRALDVKPGESPKLHFGISELDKPLSATEAMLYRGPKGEYPAGKTTRQILESGEFKLTDKMPTSETTRLAYMNEGLRLLKHARGILFNPDGSINEKTIFQMGVPGGGIGAGREVKLAIIPAITGQLLLLSGVAARPDEFDRLMLSFVPNIQDLTRKGLAEQKLKNLESLMEGNLDTIMTSLPETMRERIEERRNAGGLPPRPKPRTVTAPDGADIRNVPPNYTDEEAIKMYMERSRIQ